MEIFDILKTHVQKLDIDPTVGLEITAFIGDTDPDNQWQNLIDFTQSGDAGIYEVTISLVWNYNTPRNSGKFRWSVDGGNTWLETSEEPKDKTDHRPFSVSFPVEHTGGDRRILVEATRENDSYEMRMYYVAVIYKRIG